MKDIFYSAALSVATVFPSLLHAEDFWRVPAQSFQCIQKNAAAYLENSQDPIIIVVAACPITDVSTALSSAAQNSGLLNVGDGDSVLILTGEELRCIVAKSVEKDSFGFVNVPKGNACDQT